VPIKFEIKLPNLNKKILLYIASKRQNLYTLFLLNYNMKFDAKIRSIFVLEDKTIVFFRGRKQPNLIKKGKKIKLPDWRYWSTVSTIFVPKENEIRRIRELRLSKKTTIQVVTKESILKAKRNHSYLGLRKSTKVIF